MAVKEDKTCKTRHLTRLTIDVYNLLKCLALTNPADFDIYEYNVCRQSIIDIQRRFKGKNDEKQH